MANPAPLGVAVLGAARHAGSYLPVLAAQPGVRLVTICEEPEAPGWMWDAARALADRFGLPVGDDVAGTLARPDVDLVLVCSEPTRHARLAGRALAAGKHVLVDKPMATSLVEADRLAAAASVASGCFTVVHRLYSPAIQRARAAVQAGHLGLIRSVDVEWLASDGLSGTSVERPELVADPALSGGGEMMNFLVYPIGYLRYLTGAEVVEVYAETGTFTFEPHRRFGVEDLAMLSLRLEHDIVASVTVGRVAQAPGAGSGTSTLRLIGSHGHLSVDENQPELEIWSAGEQATRGARTIGGDAGARAVARLIEEFIHDIRSGRAPLYGAADGRATVAAIEAAYRSAATGMPVPVTPVAPVAAEHATHRA
ncbi:MAG TPA: Gfo/Idh/MocA family oxidoreductase [Thermomicrobiaceae bacterium]|nr:Gfo/Idh/MocA family oxidoreductase [Thermomicrobiaceae bacterium]